MAERSSVERRDAGEGADADRGDDLAADLAVIGAGAAGLFASIWAARTNPRVRVIALDGARKLGAKILVAGGGRCNVTHHAVSERDFSGSTPAAIRRVLERFGVAQVVEYFGSLGVALTREQTGKLFPTTDDARTILNALLDDARNHGVTLMHPARVRAVRARAGASDSNEFARFELETDIGRVAAKRIILAAGGRALPKSGSDGAGFDLARSLGHSLSERITPALVPLLLADGHWIRTIPGVAADAEVVVRDGGRIVRRDRGSVLCTHFGLSGPAVLDASRHLLNASDGTLSVRWLPGVPDDRLDAWLRAPEAPTIGAALRRTLPERLMKAACAAAGVDPTCSPQQVRREARARLVSELAPPTLPITGSRGDTFAEATAGGVPLREFALDTLESRIVAGLHACGEVLDVDGRIGGFNFQWAWSSGFVAGSGAANSMSR